MKLRTDIRNIKACSEIHTRWKIQPHQIMFTGLCAHVGASAHLRERCASSSTPPLSVPILVYVHAYQRDNLSKAFGRRVRAEHLIPSPALGKLKLHISFFPLHS